MNAKSVNIQRARACQDQWWGEIKMKSKNECAVSCHPIPGILQASIDLASTSDMKTFESFE